MRSSDTVQLLTLRNARCAVHSSLQGAEGSHPPSLLCDVTACLRYWLVRGGGVPSLWTARGRWAVGGAAGPTPAAVLGRSQCCVKWRIARQHDPAVHGL